MPWSCQCPSPMHQCPAPCRVLFAPFVASAALWSVCTRYSYYNHGVAERLCSEEEYQSAKAAAAAAAAAVAAPASTSSAPAASSVVVASDRAPASTASPAVATVASDVEVASAIAAPVEAAASLAAAPATTGLYHVQYCWRTIKCRVSSLISMFAPFVRRCYLSGCQFQYRCAVVSSSQCRCWQRCVDH